MAAAGVAGAPLTSIPGGLHLAELFSKGLQDCGRDRHGCHPPARCRRGNRNLVAGEGANPALTLRKRPAERGVPPPATIPRKTSRQRQPRHREALYTLGVLPSGESRLEEARPWPRRAVLTRCPRRREVMASVARWSLSRVAVSGASGPAAGKPAGRKRLPPRTPPLPHSPASALRTAARRAAAPGPL